MTPEGSVEERVSDYQDYMDALLAKVKVELEDYVRDIAILAWNSALSEACFELATCVIIEADDTQEIVDDLRKALEKQRL